MSEELHNQVNEHQLRIATLEETTKEVLQSLKDSTDAMNQLTTQFAVYASKHDTVSAELTTIRTKQDLHGEKIAAMLPVVDGLRGLVWKVVGAALVGGLGVGGVITAMVTYATK